MYKTRMPHTNFMKKVLWEGIQLCENVGGSRVCGRKSGNFNYGWVVYHEEGGASWELDPFSPGLVNPCCYIFLRLTPRGHGAVKIMC